MLYNSIHYEKQEKNKYNLHNHTIHFTPNTQNKKHTKTIQPYYIQTTYKPIKSR